PAGPRPAASAAAARARTGAAAAHAARRPAPATGPRGPPTPGSAALSSPTSAQARVVGDLVPDQQGVRRLRQGVQPGGPGGEGAALLLMQLPQAVVELPDGQPRMTLARGLVEFRQRAVLRGARLLPPGEVGQRGGGPRRGPVLGGCGPVERRRGWAGT